MQDVGIPLKDWKKKMTDACTLEMPDAQVLTLTLREGEGHWKHIQIDMGTLESD